MYRFEFLSKKDCFKLKLIAPKSSSVLPRTIFGWPSTEFFFSCYCRTTSTHSHEHAPSFSHSENASSLGYLWRAWRQQWQRHGVLHIRVNTQRTTEWNAIRPLGIYHSCDLWWCFQCTKTPAHHIFIRFWISCCRGWLLLLLKTLSLSHSDAHLYSLRWKFIIGCNSTYAFVHLTSSFVSLRSPIALVNRSSELLQCGIALIRTIHFQLAACK